MSEDGVVSSEKPAPLQRSVEDRQDTDVTVVRAPRYFRFMIAGAVLGVLVAFVLTISYPETATFTAGQVLGFLLLLCGAIGVGGGGLAAIIVDRAQRRRVHKVAAERLTVRK